MNKYHILIEYVGSSFWGWQIQKFGKTIQGTIQKNISKLLKEKIILIGSGRTDSGVHAIEQSAHFECKKNIVNFDRFLKSVNFFLKNESISILKIKKRDENFHARFSAKKRIYKYIIFNQLCAPVLNKKRGWHVMNKLDINRMKEAANYLVGVRDFSTFRASSCRAKSPIKKINSVKIRSKKNLIEIEFNSQSYLQQQVRSMVGCLKYVGEKKWTLKKFINILNSKKRILCAPPAPPEGLYLVRVVY